MDRKTLNDIREQLTNLTTQSTRVDETSTQSTTPQTTTQPTTPQASDQSPVGTPTLPSNLTETRRTDDGVRRDRRLPGGGVGTIDDVRRDDRNDNRNPSPPQYGLVIRLVGDSGSSVMIVDKLQQFILKTGDNQFQITHGANVSISSSNPNKFKIEKVTKLSDKGVDTQTSKAKPVKSNGREVTETVEVENVVPPAKPPIVETDGYDSKGVTSVSTQFTSEFKVISDLGIIVEVSTISNNEILKPKIIFAEPDKSRKYDIDSDIDYPILFKKISGDVDIISAFIGKERFNFDVSKLEQNKIQSDFVMILIPPTFFKNVGELGLKRLQIIPLTKNKVEGEPIETEIKLFTEKTADGDDKGDIISLLPDIVSISYPETIEPSDYVGLDVNFEIYWKSENTEYIKIYTQNNGTDGKYVQEKPNGSTKFNFKELILSQNVDYSENDKEISVVLTLIPFNEKEGLRGTAEIIKISLLKTKYNIPRDEAIQRLADSFASQLDINLFKDSTSKYLTHLLHFDSPQLVANWMGSNNSLIVKLYEPLPVSIQPNTQTFVTKIQSTPIIETVTISGFEEEFCPPLKGPNFTLDSDNGTGYRFFDELVASGSLTSTDLVNRYLGDVGIDTTNLNIEYVNDSEYVFQNFVNFGSAKERTTNFIYKIELLESYIAKFNTLSEAAIVTGSLTIENGFQLITEDGEILNWESIKGFVNPSEFNEAGRVVSQISEIIRSFDGWENFLYKSNDSLAYPKIAAYYPHPNLPIYFLRPSTSVQVQSWYESLLVYAENFDKLNSNYLNNNLPEFLTNDIENNDFILFMDMIGQHFDVIWSYIKALNRKNSKAESSDLGIPNELVWHLLKSFGWDGKRAFDSQFLWEYAFGEYKDGTPKYGISLEEANNQIWRRIANNLPYLLKHKGTSRAMKAIMACYGVPQSLLTIMEFGGPQDPTKGGTSKFTFDDRTAAIHLEPSASIIVPWKSGNYVGGWGSSYPQALEFRFKPEVVKTTRIISAPQFSVDIIQTTGSFARLDLVFGEGSAEPYFAPTASGHEYITASIVYALGPVQYTSSLDFPLSTENYSSILVNKHQYTGFDGMYEVLLRTTDGQRITTAVSMSFRTDSRFWDSGSNILIGNNFSGELDEVRLWTEPLSRSKFDNHSLFPDAINGNRLKSSTEDLLLRLDFEYPKDRILDPLIKNVAISDVYTTTYVSASNMYSAPTYPFQYVPYDRTVTANVPSLGFNYSNKIRFEEQFNINGESVENGIVLSHKLRATQKSFDKAPVDSSRLGLFFSPVKELNMDILKAFGDFNIDNYIGDPSDEYSDSYKELENLRNYYFERLNRNINEYITLVKYIDKSLFDVLADLAPARAKISKGLLIEPHYLERSKTRWDKPTSQRNDFQTSINNDENVFLESTYHSYNAILDTETNTQLISEISKNEGLIDVNDKTTLVGEPSFYSSTIDYNVDNLLSGDTPFYDVVIYMPTGSSLVGEADTFKSEIIGFDPNSLASKGFGLYAERGVTIDKYYDIFGNYTSSRQNVFLVKEQYQKKIKTQTKGWPTIGALPGESVVFENVINTFERLKVSLLPFSGSIVVANNILEVTPLIGYFPTHYKFVNNLSKGLTLSFFDGSKQTELTTPDGLPPVETFTTNPNILRVASTGRGSGEPILQVD